ncbi:MAG TPA: potassium transporter TrkG, partial [bacterium]|nr:potassium transporter TrkG [bacterium]
PALSQKIIRILDSIMLLLGFGVIGSLLLEYGFYIPADTFRILHYFDYSVLFYFVAHNLVKLLLVSDKADLLRTHRLDFTFIGLLFLFLLLYNPFWQVVHFADHLERVPMRQIAKLYITITQIFILLAALFTAIKFTQRFAFADFRPITILLGSFAIMILAGTGLLMLPKATAYEQISFVDALFTATSATCVTGLIVVDTGIYFSHLGHWIIMLLIQAGGLGIMTMAAFFAIALGTQMSVTGRMVMRDLLAGESMEKIGQSLWQILGLTIFFETIGVVAFYSLFPADAIARGGRLFNSLFHAVSAFCNAGFSTYSDSLVQFADHGMLVGVFAGLIIIGGLGFPVLINLLGHRFFGTTGPFGKKQLRVRMQTHVVLWTSGVLILSGAIWIWWAHFIHTGAGPVNYQIIIHSLFQSITARTAGFNTIDIGSLALPALLGIMILMFIGASPGSTGGGIKTTTFYLSIRAMWAKLRGLPAVEHRHRTIPSHLLYRSLLLILGSQLVVMISFVLLTVVESQEPMALLFETFSAFGTVGLSMGATPELSTLGKYIIIATMFTGRVGPLAFVIALGGKQRKQLYEYPEESVMLG